MARHDIVERRYRASGAQVAVLAARFNHEIVERLREAAEATLQRHGVAGVDTFHVPGAFELPLAARRLAESGRYRAVIALGAVIRGDTPHFDHVAGQCAAGLMQAGLASGVPVIFGVLTCDDQAQAEARSGGAHGNKGHESALAALEMIDLFERLEEPTR